METANTANIDHDKNFKELISTFFLEFLELFLPAIATTIEPDSITFLQQEYFVDVGEGKEKIIDLLAQVKQAGRDATFLIHLYCTRAQFKGSEPGECHSPLRQMLGRGEWHSPSGIQAECKIVA